jgi:hypothetical protein
MEEKKEGTRKRERGRKRGQEDKTEREDVKGKERMGEIQIQTPAAKYFIIAQTSIITVV